MQNNCDITTAVPCVCVYVHLNCRRKKNERKKIHLFLCECNQSWSVYSECLFIYSVELACTKEFSTFQQVFRAPCIHIDLLFRKRAFTLKTTQKSTLVRKTTEQSTRASKNRALRWEKKIRFTNRKGQFVHSFQYIDSIQYRALYRTQPIRLCCR